MTNKKRSVPKLNRDVLALWPDHTMSQITKQLGCTRSQVTGIISRAQHNGTAIRIGPEEKSRRASASLRATFAAWTPEQHAERSRLIRERHATQDPASTAAHMAHMRASRTGRPYKPRPHGRRSPIQPQPRTPHES